MGSISNFRPNYLANYVLKETWKANGFFLTPSKFSPIGPKLLESILPFTQSPGFFSGFGISGNPWKSCGTTKHTLELRWPPNYTKSPQKRFLWGQPVQPFGRGPNGIQLPRHFYHIGTISARRLFWPTNGPNLGSQGGPFNPKKKGILFFRALCTQEEARNLPYILLPGSFFGGPRGEPRIVLAPGCFLQGFSPFFSSSWTISPFLKIPWGGSHTHLLGRVPERGSLGVNSGAFKPNPLGLGPPLVKPGNLCWFFTPPGSSRRLLF